MLWRKCVSDCLKGNGCNHSFPSGAGSLLSITWLLGLTTTRGPDLGAAENNCGLFSVGTPLATITYLPLQEGGQGLVDIASRVTAFRLQTAQRLLYSFGLPWTDTACLLLRRRGVWATTRSSSCFSLSPWL